MIFHAKCLGATIDDENQDKKNKVTLTDKQLEAIKRSTEERMQALGLKKYERK